jgi:hypothetical protein
VALVDRSILARLPPRPQSQASLHLARLRYSSFMRKLPQPYLRPGAHRWYDGTARYLAFATVLVTVASTAVVFLKTDNQLGTLKDLVAAGIALVGLAISVQLEILFRVTERSQTREQFGRLLEGVEDYPDLLPVAIEVLEASITTLRRTSVPQFRSEVFAILTHAGARLEELAQGRLRREGSDNNLVFDRFAQARTRILGTTDERDVSWWRGSEGQRFLRLNTDLIDKYGVEVERLWLFDHRPDGNVAKLLEDHRVAKIRNYVVWLNQPGLDHRLLVNLTLMDRSFLQQDVPNRRGDAVEYLYSENGADIERAENALAQLMSRASEYVGPDSLDDIFGSQTDTRVNIRRTPT